MARYATIVSTGRHIPEIEVSNDVLRQRFASKEVQTPVGTMTYWEGGSGPCMFLLHGAGDQAGTWARIVPELAAKVMRALLGPETSLPPGFVLDDVVRHAKDGPAARFAETAHYVLDGRLHEITVPVELVWGDSDGLMPLSYARRMLEELPRARLTTIKECGHIPQRECPHQLRGALLGALSEPAEKSKVAIAEQETP